MIRLWNLYENNVFQTTDVQLVSNVYIISDALQLSKHCLQSQLYHCPKRYSSCGAQWHTASINHLVSDQLEQKQMSGEYEDQA